VLERAIGKDFPIAAITESVLERITISMLAGEDRKPKAKPRSPATVNRKLDNLKRLLSFCVKWKVIDRMPVFEESFPETKGREWVMEDDMEGKIYEALLARDDKPAKKNGEHNRKRDAHLYKALYIVLVETGLRHGEAFKLTWRDHVRLETRTIHFRTRREVKADASVRPVPITDRCYEALKMFLDVPAGPFKQLNMRRAQDLWKEATQACGIYHKDCVPHALRHTAGTRVLEVTGDIRLTQQWLGHSDIKTTERYAKVMSKRMRQAAGLLNDRSAAQNDEALSSQRPGEDRDRESPLSGILVVKEKPLNH
jgi:integrase